MHTCAECLCGSWTKWTNSTIAALTMKHMKIVQRRMSVRWETKLITENLCDTGAQLELITLFSFSFFHFSVVFFFFLVSLQFYSYTSRGHTSIALNFKFMCDLPCHMKKITLKTPECVWERGEERERKVRDEHKVNKVNRTQNELLQFDANHNNQKFWLHFLNGQII